MFLFLLGGGFKLTPSPFPPSVFFTRIKIYWFFGFFFRTFLLNNSILKQKFQFLQIWKFLLIFKVEHKSFPMMYHFSCLDIGFRGWGQIDPLPSSVSWFSSTQVGIGLSRGKGVQKNYSILFVFNYWNFKHVQGYHGLLKEDEGVWGCLDMERDLALLPPPGPPLGWPPPPLDGLPGPPGAPPSPHPQPVGGHPNGAPPPGNTDSNHHTGVR